MMGFHPGQMGASGDRLLVRLRRWQGDGRRDG